MNYFMIRFLICNILICGLIVVFLLIKKILKKNLSSRMQYNLWYILLGLFAVPFITFCLNPVNFTNVFTWFQCLTNRRTSGYTSINSGKLFSRKHLENNLINDFTLSVNNKIPSAALNTLLEIWLIGIFIMIILMVRSALHLYKLKKSALPLQNEQIREQYILCLKEMNININIPIYSTAFLKSPIIVGLFRPCIYIPIHLISNYNASDIRYMLLHELHHFKHKDSISIYLMNIAFIIYWFNPFVWYALKEMRTDCEIACDTSVLEMLDKKDYIAYGNTLINFADKISHTSFPFSIGLSGNFKQMRQRILNIASYKELTNKMKLRSFVSFTMIAALLLGFTPFISTNAADTNHYDWNNATENISYIDLSSYFSKYNGSFVLYDLKSDTWRIYNKNLATKRVSPDSTYKIYDALLGLEEDIITPEDSFIAWNGEKYPFEAWNADQTLNSAMASSVNWYFQSIDRQLTYADIHNYIHQIKYGNENLGSNLSSYWLESSLKISPVEQVELLMKLQNNSFGFSSENINAVKNSICLSSSSAGKFYGKTGTGRVNGKDINGWFIGYIEIADNTYFFANNIESDDDAAGSNAAKITMSILSDLNIWK